MSELGLVGKWITGPDVAVRQTRYGQVSGSDARHAQAILMRPVVADVCLRIVMIAQTFSSCLVKPICA